MPKRAISVTLDGENITWLKGRAGAAGLRSVSELLDQLVSAARSSGAAGVSKSVVGTIDIDAEDPALLHADDAVSALFAASLRRPMMVRETPAEYGGRRPPSKRRG